MLDAKGQEQLRVSRLAMDVVGSQTDFSKDPSFVEARAGQDRTTARCTSARSPSPT